MVELSNAIVAHEAKKVMKRKKALRETALSSRGVREDEKILRRLGKAMRWETSGRCGLLTTGRFSWW